MKFELPKSMTVEISKIIVDCMDPTDTMELKQGILIVGMAAMRTMLPLFSDSTSKTSEIETKSEQIGTSSVPMETIQAESETSEEPLSYWTSGTLSEQISKMRTRYRDTTTHAYFNEAISRIGQKYGKALFEVLNTNDSIATICRKHGLTYMTFKNRLNKHVLPYLDAIDTSMAKKCA